MDSIIRYLGLDWYVSPFSLGVIASYIIDLEWFIYFFGAVSIIQLWIIGFQAKYLSNLTDMKRWKVWLMVILWHFFVYCIVATLSLFDVELIEWWLSS